MTISIEDEKGVATLLINGINFNALNDANNKDTITKLDSKSAFSEYDKLH